MIGGVQQHAALAAGPRWCSAQILEGHANFSPMPRARIGPGHGTLSIVRERGIVLRFHALSDVGRKRKANQDHALACPGIGLWAVADGMGGRVGGERASRVACETLKAAVTSGLGLNDAFLRAHHAVCEEQLCDPALAEMGTTLVAIAEQGCGFELGWVGDSRAYRCRTDAAFEALTTDQNVPQMLLAAGCIRSEDVAGHPREHVLTDCIGQSGEQPPMIETRSLKWQAGDRLLLCSDGLNREVDDQRIGAILAASADAETAANRLRVAALTAGGRDNVTVIVIDAPRGA